MSEAIQVIELRSCRQCGCVLSPKCPACVKNRRRLPKVLYVSAMPEVLKEGICGNCVQIRCAYTLCQKPIWREKSTARKYERCFCPKPAVCCQKQKALDNSKQVSMVCSNSLCARGDGGKRKTIMVPQNRLKRANRIFCCNSCHYIDGKKAVFEKRAKEVDDRRQMLDCAGTCRAVTVHEKVSPMLYKCIGETGQNGCGRTRDGRIDSLLPSGRLKSEIRR